MFSKFFISRPKFAMVISIVLSIAGVLALFSLPVALYPQIQPPSVYVSASYPGASADVIASSVGIPIEDSVNGVPGMLYMESESSSDGSYSLAITFDTDVDQDIAQTEVQNRLQQATSKLPTDVSRQGVRVRTRSPDTLGYLTVNSPNGSRSVLYLADYMENNIKNNLIRVDGVGDVMVRAAKASMRVWLDANKMTALGITVSDITKAVESQNTQTSLGSVGTSPTTDQTSLTYSLKTEGRLNEVDKFKDIIIRTNESGGVVRLSDIAEVKIEEESFGIFTEFNGEPSVSISINTVSGANAVQTMQNIRDEIERLTPLLPEDVAINVMYDTTLYISASIQEVLITLGITFFLVALVCYIFLQDVRATIIPTLTIPTSLLSTFAVLLVLGYSINLLTLFGLVLAIGLVVDDAIVVVERVLALMEKEGLSGKEAAYKAMDEVSGAVIATTLVLLAIFVPIGFLGGITGKIYQQFAVAISTAVVFSSLNALTLSPALCGVILKPLKERKTGFLAMFNKNVKHVRNIYVYWMQVFGRKIIIVAMFLLLTIAGTFGVLNISSTSFIPQEDQGAFFATVQLPEGASSERTYKIVKQLEDIFKKEKGVVDTLAILGVSFGGVNGENSAAIIVALGPWDERTDPELHPSEIIDRMRKKTANIPGANINFFERPSIPGLGSSSGIAMKLQSYNSADPQELDNMTQALLGKISDIPGVRYAYSDYTAKTPNIFIDIDRKKAEAMDVGTGAVLDVLQNYLGSYYVNDVNFGTQVNKVVLQANWDYRKNPEAIKKLYVVSEKGKFVPLSSLIELRKELAPRGINRYNQYPASGISVMLAPGFASGDVMKAIENLFKDPEFKGYGFEWTGATYQEAKSQGQVGYLILMAILFGYLFLVAQYESWMTPVPVLLSVFVAMFGSLSALYIMGLSLSIYAQLGLILIVGLGSKSAILIVEFAQTEREKGTDLIMAAKIATQERFRAVLMTAFTFILGVFPMIIASGAGAAARRALGTPVFYGMLIGTVVGLLATPLLYILIMRIKESFKKQN